MAVSSRPASGLAVLALLVVLAGGASAQITGSQGCPVTYGGQSTPLLFGGLFQVSCRHADGQACIRAPKWAESCKFDPSREIFPVCSAEARAINMKFASELHLGAPNKLSPCDLYPYIRGRTLWLMGDSHTKQLFRALQCFMIDFWEDQRECKVVPNDDLVRQLDTLPTMPGESKCIHLKGNGRICIAHVVLGTSLLNNPVVADDGALNLIRNKMADPNDIFVIQFGPWHAKLGAPGMEQHKIALQQLGEDFQRNKARFPHVIWRETPMTHPRDDNAKVCLPAPAGWNFNSYTGNVEVADAARSSGAALLSRGGSVNVWAHEILPQYGIPIMKGFAYSVPLYNTHIGMRGVTALDCLHYCHHGLPEILVYELTRQLRSGIAGVKPGPYVPPERVLPCAPMPIK